MANTNALLKAMLSFSIVPKFLYKVTQKKLTITKVDFMKKEKKKTPLRKRRKIWYLIFFFFEAVKHLYKKPCVSKLISFKKLLNSFNEKALKIIQITVILLEMLKTKYWGTLIVYLSAIVFSVIA